MEINVKKLRDVLDLLEPVLPKKGKLPVIQNFRLGGGKAIATDLDLTVSVDLPEATETILLPGGARDFLKLIPGNRTAALSQKGLAVAIVSGAEKRTFVTKDPEEFPEQTGLPAAVSKVDGDRFVRDITLALPYAASEQTRPVLTGVILFMEGPETRIAAGDGFRMYLKSMPGLDYNRTAILSAETVRVLAHLWKLAPKGNDPSSDTIAGMVLSKRFIALGFYDDVLVATFGPLAVRARLIAGTPPNFYQLVPKDPSQTLRVLAPDFLQAVLRVRDVAKEGSGIVRLNWDDRTVTVTASAAEVGDAETSVTPLSIEGGPGRIAFNSKYLVEYFQKRQGVITIGVTDPSSPALFQDGQCDIVIMPMFVAEPKPDGEAVAVESHRPPENEAPRTTDTTEDEKVADGAEEKAGDATGPKTVAAERTARDPRPAVEKVTRTHRKLRTRKGAKEPAVVVE